MCGFSMERYKLDGLVAVRDNIRQLLEERERVIVAFDGRSAAGKSTAARWISFWLDGEVVHMDDFFLPPMLRTPERLAQPGGNVHYERVLSEVINPLQRGEVAEYGVFDCSVMDISGVQRAGEKQLVIIEGAYSLHPAFGSYFDLAVFFDIDPQEQIKRITERNGAEKLVSFTERWIPMEERYIAACNVAERCHMAVKGEIL